MRTLAIPALLVALLLPACGGGDPEALTNAGSSALGRGDAQAALESFDAALAQMTPDHRDFLRASIGRCEALARTDPKAARDAFLALAKSYPSKVKEADFSLVCNALVRAGAMKEAVEVMHQGNLMFVDSPGMKAVHDAVSAAANKTPEGRNALEGLGYAGGG